jgi:branched-chain amino acid transport system ATP-binding protein
MSRILEIENLHVSYGPIKAIKGIDLHIEEGEAIAVVGANGAGKSTLLRTISQVVKKASGKILFGGTPVDSMSTARLAQNGLVHVPEGRGTLTKLTVMENLLTAYEARWSRSARKLDEALAEIFSYFPRLEERKEQLAGSLSGGEQQMLAIAKALMIRPRLLMLDEPSLGLSPLFVGEIFRIIERLRKEGISILLVEQNARQALKVVDRGYVLSSGKIVMKGGGAELLGNNQMLSAYLGG